MDAINQAFEHGGVWMWPIFFVGVLVLGFTLERTHFLYIKAASNRDTLLKSLENKIRANDIDGAVQTAAKNKSPLGRVLLEGVRNYRENNATVQLLMDEAAITEIPKLERYTGFLVMFSNIGTLLGLLGTIVGLIRSFAAVASASAGEKATELAAGISEAMNCTAFGLIVAIPALLAYAVLKAREHKLVDEINHSTVVLYNIIADVKRSQGAQ